MGDLISLCLDQMSVIYLYLRTHIQFEHSVNPYVIVEHNETKSRWHLKIVKYDPYVMDFDRTCVAVRIATLTSLWIIFTV